MAKPTARKRVSLKDLKVRRGGATHVKGGAPGNKYFPAPSKGGPAPTPTPSPTPTTTPTPTTS
jgi:hypothetical protein